MPCGRQMVPAGNQVPTGTVLATPALKHLNQVPTGTVLATPLLKHLNDEDAFTDQVGICPKGI